MARKTLSILLALCMVLSLMPFGAFAANNAATGENAAADGATYVPAYQIVSGGKYLITTGDSGSVNALNGGSSSVSATAVDVAADGSITLDNSALVWNAEMSSDVLALKNSSSGRYLSVQNYGTITLRTSSSAYGSWFFGYYQLQRQGSSSTYTVYFNNGNFTVTTNSTDAKLYLFVEQGTADPGTPPTPPPTPTPELEAGTYVVVANGNALTANHAEGYAQGGTADYQYHGLRGVPFTEGETTVTYKMVWTVEAVDGGFTFSNDGKYLSATYESLTNGATSDLVVSDLVDVWSLSNHQLHSANCDKYLYYASTENIFSVRSASSAATLTFIAVEPVAPCTHDDVDIVGAVDATCTEDGYTGDLACTACGEVFEAGAVIPALGHDWGEWVVTTPAGDLTPGEKTRTCARCGATETQEIEPLNAPTYELVDRLVAGVDYLIVNVSDGAGYAVQNKNGSVAAFAVTVENEKITTIESSLVWTAETNEQKPEWFNLKNDGQYIQRVSGSPALAAELANPARGWAYNDGSLQHMGSSNGNYTLRYSTSSSNFTFNTSTDKVYLFAPEGAVQPCAHEEFDVVGAKDATCTEAGYTGDVVCTACGETLEEGVTVPALGHDWSEWTVTTPAGEYTPGEETRTCSRCDAAETREIEPLHVPTYVQVDRLVDGVEYLIVSTNQDGTAYVLTNPGATTSGASMGATEVTIADGKITGYHDGTLWLATANGERFDLTNEGGYLEGKGGNIKIYSTQQYPNRAWAYSDAYLEHLGGNYTYEVYHNGTSFTYAQYSAGTAPSHPVYLFALEGAVLPCQHEHLIEHAAKEANCTEAGNDAYWECEDCHKLFSDAGAQNVIEEPVVYEALGHNWGEWTLVTAAGATTPGSEKRVCSRCGEQETRATDPTGVLEPGTYVIVIGGNAVTTVRSANTAQGGTSEYQYTGMDGVPYVDGETEVTAAMIWTVEAVDGGYVIRSGENYLNGTYAGTVGDLAVSDQSDVWTIDSTRLKSTNASAGNSGKFLGYVINKDLFTMRSYRPESPDANLQMDVVFYPVEAFVCDHASTETRGAVEATCTEPGFTGDVYCTVCGEKIADGEAIPALGHSWDEGVVTQRPTGSAEGVKTFTCTRCGETRTESIPKLVNPFVDVAAGKFYFEPVLWAFYSDPQVTSGVTKTTFEPDRVCTRAHVVTFLWRANGCPEPANLNSNFKDVKDTSKYYYKAVLWAAEQGITTGYSDGTFRPEAECTRGQVVTFLWRSKGQPAPTSTTNPFSDVANGKYYTTAVLWALENNITTGRTPTTFGPNDSCTRGHVVTFLYRAYAD